MLAELWGRDAPAISGGGRHEACRGNPRCWYDNNRSVCDKLLPLPRSGRNRMCYLSDQQRTPRRDSCSRRVPFFLPPLPGLRRGWFPSAGCGPAGASRPTEGKQPRVSEHGCERTSANPGRRGEGAEVFARSGRTGAVRTSDTRVRTQQAGPGTRKAAKTDGRLGTVRDVGRSRWCYR